MSIQKHANGYQTRSSIAWRAIHAITKQIAETFHPLQVILFGSQATGRADAESDVDLLIVMRCKDPIDQSIKIRETLSPPFALDLVVIDPDVLQNRLAANDWMLKSIMNEGKVLYAKPDQGMGQKSRRRSSTAPRHGKGSKRFPNLMCYHSQ
jgi:uncharacterized protein